MSVRKTYETRVNYEAQINDIIKNEELFSKGRMFAHVRLLKDKAVDWHIHTGEIEYYYIISGKGVFTNSDKTEQIVGAGDVCIMDLGGGHAIKQIGDETLEFIALIINTD